MSTATDASPATASALAGKYLTVLIGRESYGIAVTKVREIIRLQPVTTVPQMPACIKGVINLRGRIVPVLDLRLKLHTAEVVNTERTCIVVTRVALASGADRPMGLIVDGVEEVANLTAADIAEKPDFGTTADTSHILGMAHVKGVVKTLLDLDRVAGADQLASLAA
jgi:purine-binding chemotaxis protein CheW